MYTKRGKVPWMLVFNLKNLIFVIQKLEEIKFVHLFFFIGGGGGGG